MAKRILHNLTDSPQEKAERERAEREQAERELIAKERLRLQTLPRYVETETNLPGFKVKIPDGPSFLASWMEIFDREIYKFKTENNSPRILDCGANVGVSCIFFKKFYPQARITAFEPDLKIANYLQHNLESAGIKDIELIKKAVWSSETTLHFHSEGSDGGRIEALPGGRKIEVQTVRLRDYLNENIDLLKIDIEGAETDVMRDVAPQLQNVRNLFVEYHSFANIPQTLDELLGIIKRAGFRFHLQPVHAFSQPLFKVDEYMGMDLQLNIFGCR